MTPPIVLSTLGSLGDLFPVLALAEALERRGQPARLLLSPEDTDRARSRGLDAHPFGPTEAQLSARLGLSRSQIAAQVFADPTPILKQATYPMLPDLARQILPLVQDARMVCHTILALAAPLAAEIAGRPAVPLLLQPLLMRSALDPARVRGFSPPMVPRPGAVGAAWNRAWLTVVGTEFRRRLGPAQDRARSALALPRTAAVPPFDQAVAPPLRLGLWDPALADTPPDRPDIVVTGAPRLAGTEPLPRSLADFLAAGPPPLVVTLGSVSHSLHGPDFNAAAVAAARARGLRSVILTGGEPAPEGPDVAALPFADHDALFPQAKAVLHHGGMGTLQSALHARVPQLILPVGADQPDNASRLQDLGVARRLHDTGGIETHLAPGDLTRMRDRALSLDLVTDGADRAAATLIDTCEDL